MDYPSDSDDEDSDFVLEEPEETEESDHVIDSGMELSSSDSDESSIIGNVQEDRGRYCYRLQRFHKDAFYSAYLPEWEKAKKNSHLICQEKYDEIVALLRTTRQKKEPARLLKYRLGMLRDVAFTITGMVNLLLFPLLKTSLTFYLRCMQKAVIQKVAISIYPKNLNILNHFAESFFWVSFLICLEKQEHHQ